MKITQAQIVYVAVFGLLVLLAAFKPVGFDRDYFHYAYWFRNSELLNPISMEPTFLIISWFLKEIQLNNLSCLFLVYALLGVGLKFKAIHAYSDLIGLSILVYISNFYLLHELTQVRVGVASGIFLLSIKSLSERDLKKYALFVVVATLFHYSSLIMIPLWFVKNNNRNLYKYVLILSLSYLLHFINFHITSLLKLIPIEQIAYKISIYEEVMDTSGQHIEFKIFNLFNLINLFASVLMLIKFDVLQKKSSYAPLLIKIHVLAVSVFALFADIPAFAFRLSEFLGTVEIILLPLLIYVFKQKDLSFFIFILLVLLKLTINIKNLIIVQ